ncbi:MAG TPA: hypothetical protein VFO60_09420, partial [Candidatus Dormibacteraeota bacterium]|nr:hypothetical protein [Candidatus Dormibacteraeota bacterium]
MTEVRPLRVRIRAPRIFVFQCLSTFDRSSPVWCTGFEPQILDQDGDALVVRFRERTLGRLVSSVVRIRMRPPDCIEEELLDGVLAGLRESLVLSGEGDSSTSVVWSAELAVRVPVAAGPIERLCASRMLRTDAQRSLDRYRVTIEAA